MNNQKSGNTTEPRKEGAFLLGHPVHTLDTCVYGAFIMFCMSCGFSVICDIRDCIPGEEKRAEPCGRDDEDVVVLEESEISEIRLYRVGQKSRPI